ncbi:MAG: winged helix-turn-helix transcriptional regulator [Candidatus Thermoplasmatota archaeon]|nr:winged helix-turn-helix transcriptional regulator [Candidatus Thermoplasmatota archaeon]
MKDMMFHWENKGRRMVEVLKAFADVNRMKIIRVLAANPEESVCVSDLARVLGITQPAVSQNIRILKSIGLLAPKRVKNMTYYSIEIDKLKEYKDEIDEMFMRAMVRCTFEGSCDECSKRSCFE